MDLDDDGHDELCGELWAHKYLIVDMKIKKS